MTKAEHFAAALAREGLVSEVDADGDLRFRFEGGHYVLYPDPDDEPYVRILFPNFWAIESDDERERAYRAASRATRRCKGAKVWLRDDDEDVCASIEAFLPGPEFLEYVLARMLSALQYAARQFRDEMQTGPDGDASGAPGDVPGLFADADADAGRDDADAADLDALLARYLRDALPPSGAPDDSPGDRIAGQLGDLPPGDTPDADAPRLDGPDPDDPDPDGPGPDDPDPDGPDTSRPDPEDPGPRRV